MIPPCYTHIALSSIDSTQDEAARLLAAGKAGHGTLVSAEVQTQGRGRFDRVWVSKPGNLYASLIVQPKANPAAWVQLSFVTALAVAHAVQDCLPQKQAMLKWPNDVLVSGRKIAGILLERQTGKTGQDFMVIGFGVNCADHPKEAAYPATDLSVEGASTGAEALLGLMMSAFDRYYGQWLKDGFAPIRAAWLKKAAAQGAPMTIRQGAKELSGVFADIAPEDGSLIIETTEGVRVCITAGDVYQ